MATIEEINAYPHKPAVLTEKTQSNSTWIVPSNTKTTRTPKQNTEEKTPTEIVTATATKAGDKVAIIPKKGDSTNLTYNSPKRRRRRSLNTRSIDTIPPGQEKLGPLSNANVFVDPTTGIPFLCLSDFKPRKDGFEFSRVMISDPRFI